MNFVGLALPLADTDLPRYGSLIGVGEDEVHAFLEVETNGHGFDAQRRPKMLFEPHKFWAALDGEAREAAVRAGVAYPKQGTRPYPADSYPALVVALSIDQDAALKSASWGLGQVLGSNYALTGYPDVLTYVQAMMAGEAQQLAAAIAFIKSTHLDDELRAHNWPAFARGYNGPNYAKFGYADKLAAAFAKWSKIKDTPWPVAASVTMAEALRAPGAHPTADGHLAPRPVVVASTELKPPQIAASPGQPVLNSIIGRINQAAADEARTAAPAVRSPGPVTLPTAAPSAWSRFVSLFTRKAA